MKKLAILAVLACMVFGFAATASAVDVDAKGKFQFQMNIMDNQDLLSAKDGGTAEDDMNFWFRARSQFRFIANENLWAVLYTEYKTRVGSGVSTTNGNDSSLKVKEAYFQYRFPGTEVLTTAGVKNFGAPGAVAGNVAIGDMDTGLFMVETPITDQIAVAAAFSRVYDLNESDATWGAGDGVESNDELDLFYAALPITIDGLGATPYFAYANIGKNTTIPAQLQGVAPTAYTKNFGAWWVGTSFEMDMFDPIVVAADIVYGNVDADEKQNDRSGVFFDASIAYTGLDFVQPKLAFAYGTGEDDDTDNGSERLPIINNDWAIGSTYFGGSAFTGTCDMDSNNQMGMWTVGLMLENISFLEKLSHDVNFLFIKGTNDADLIKNTGAAVSTSYVDGTFLTDEDTAIEVDFNTTYQIYDELAAIVELAYVNVDFDKDTWRNTARGDDSDPLLKCVVGLIYNF